MRKCAECGEEFAPYADTDVHTYCSHACMRRASRRRAEKRIDRELTASDIRSLIDSRRLDWDEIMRCRIEHLRKKGRIK